MATSKAGTDRFVLGGRTYVVDLKAKLGAGSEGTVFAHPHDPTLCVKLFHPPDPRDNGAQKDAQYRARKVRTVCGLNLALPRRFMLPQVPVFDTASKIIGFQMERVPAGYFKLLELTNGSFRTDYQQGLRTVTELFANFFDDLEVIHKAGLVVGDVNLGCVLFEPGKDRAWVDTDSWSYPGFPCMATTELFAHPDLYDNLEPGGTLVLPRRHHDYFAFTVALTMMAIPGGHPFRMGSHQKVSGLQDRTRAGLTIFDSDVKTPAMMASPEILSDELLQALIDRLKRRDESPLSPDMLRAFAHEVTFCGSCGIEYHASRRHCPQCRQVTLVQAPTLVSYIIEELFKARGTLLFAQVVNNDLYLVCRVGNRVNVAQVDHKGATRTLTTTLLSVPGARYRFFANCLVVCLEPGALAPAKLEVYRINGMQLEKLSTTSTGVLEGDGAVFDTSSRFLYRTAGNTLLRGELFGANNVVDTPVAEVYQNQTWFTADRSTGADREVVFGYDRALRSWEWFIIHGTASGGHFAYYKVGDLGLRIGETVDNFAVYFSASSVLLAMHTSFAGRDYVRYAVIGLDGTVHLNKMIDDSDEAFPYWVQLRGKLHQGKSVLHVTAQGVVKQDFSSGSCMLLGDTTGHIAADDQLIRFGGQVGIVNRRGVLAMVKK